MKSMEWIFRGNMRHNVTMEKNAKFVVSDAILGEIQHYMELCGVQRAAARRNSEPSNGDGTQQRSSVDYSWLATNYTGPGSKARSQSLASTTLDSLPTANSQLTIVPETDVLDASTASELPYMTELERAELEDLALKLQPDEYVRTVKLFRRKLAALASYRTTQGHRPDGFDQSEASVVTGPNNDARRNSNNLLNLPDECSSTSSSTSSLTGLEIGPPPAPATNPSSKSASDLDLACIKPREIPNVMRLTIYNILDARHKATKKSNTRMSGGSNKVMPSSQYEEGASESVTSTLSGGGANRKSLGIGSTIINVPQTLDTTQLDIKNNRNSANPRRNTTHNLPV